MIDPKKERKIIRNKSWDNFWESSIFLENRYRNSLKHNKVICDYELFEITKKISNAIPFITKETFSWNFLRDMWKIIGEFIESNDLHLKTDRLKKIIVKFDDCKQTFVKALMVKKNKIEMEEFCSKMLYRIRYIFSKLGRVLNLHENPMINQWISKGNKKLLK